MILPSFTKRGDEKYFWLDKSFQELHFKHFMFLTEVDNLQGVPPTEGEGDNGDSLTTRLVDHKQINNKEELGQKIQKT